MTSEEQRAWIDLKITNKTFQKTKQEKIDLANKKAEHKKYVREHPEYKGVK